MRAMGLNPTTDSVIYLNENGIDLANPVDVIELV